MDPGQASRAYKRPEKQTSIGSRPVPSKLPNDRISRKDLDIDKIKWKGGNLQLKRQDCRTNNCVTLQTSRFYTGYETLLWSIIPVAQHEEMSVTSIPTNSHVLNYCWRHCAVHLWGFR